MLWLLANLKQLPDPQALRSDTSTGGGLLGDHACGSSHFSATAQLLGNVAAVSKVADVNNPGIWLPLATF